MDLSKEILSNITVYMKYAKYIPQLNRRETWDELVTRNMNMHIEKFPQLSDEIASAYNFVREKKILPSMRSLQFAGKPIALNNSRIFNCSYLPMDSWESFGEVMFLLLSGCGVGYSVQKHHVEKLPTITIPTKTRRYLVSDSIEGWADAVKVLMKAYFCGKPLPVYDFGDIRPKGAQLITAGGKAPGPEPLKDCLHNIKKILDRKQNGEQLNPLEVHDINCYIADAVLAGGIRRCLPEGSRVHTKRGMIPIECVEIGDEVLTSKGYKKVSNKFDQGEQTLYRVKTQDSYIDATANHRLAVLTGEDKYEFKMVKNLKLGDRLVAPSMEIEGEVVSLPQFSYNKPKGSTTCKDIIIPELDEDMAWLLGLIQGNGYVLVDSRGGQVNIACNKEYTEIIPRATKQLERFGVSVGVTDYENYLVLRVKSKQLATYFHSWLKQAKTPLLIPEFMWRAKTNIKMSYVSGLLDSDGSTKTRPPQVLCTVYKSFAEDVRLLLSSCGVQTRFKALSTANLKDGWQKKYAVVVINKHARAKLSKYTIKQFNELYQENKTNSYPKEILDFTYPNNYPWTNTNNKLIPVEIIGIELLDGVRPTWDIEVEDVHEFFVEGYLSHNSATICLFDLDDDDMLTCKFGNWWETNPQRGRANNSAVIVRHMIDKEVFLKLWEKIKLSGSGEPGLFFTNDKDYGTNPCLTGDTLVATADGRGYVDFKTLAEEGLDVPVFCLNEKGVMVSSVMRNPRITGKGKKIYKITLDDGNIIRATENHKFPLKNGKIVEVKDLVVGDELITNKSETDSVQTEFKYSPLELFSKMYNAFKNQETFGDFYFKHCEISGEQFMTPHREVSVKFEYANIHKNKLENMYKSMNNNDNFIKVKSIEFDGYEDVYNGTVDKYHNFFIGNFTSKDNTNYSINTMNCGEIALRPYSFCNLVTINADTLESQEDFNERAKAASFIASLQASYTNFHYLRDIWKRNTDKDALIGVSMTGVASGKVLKLNLTEAAKIVNEENKRVSALIGTNASARSTTLKPEGTASLVLGTSSGIHAWHNDYYIRRIRVGKDEAIYNYLSKNHPELVEDEYFKPNIQAVISIPQKAPDGATIRSETAIDLLTRVAKVYKEWISPGHRKGPNKNNVSTTVSIKDHEWEEVGEWMWENRGNYSGLSVLPYSDHTYIQAPFEDSTKEKFEELYKTLNSVDLTKIIEIEDNTNLSDQAACAGGACEII